MDAYHVHRKIQEAILAVEIYNLRSTARSIMWDADIKRGLDELTKHRNILFSSRDRPAVPSSNEMEDQ